MCDFSLQLLGTNATLSNTSVNVNGNLTVNNGAALKLQLQNASLSVSGDLRIEDGVFFLCGLVAIVRQMNLFSSRCFQCLSIIIALLVAYCCGWCLCAGLQVVDGHFPSPQFLWRRPYLRRKKFVSSRVLTSFSLH